jgi:hypothetical protein
MVTSVGTPTTVAAQELRLECMFPADDATEARHRQLLSASWSGATLVTGPHFFEGLQIRVFDFSLHRQSADILNAVPFDMGQQ